ncbi:hypothetical protein E4U21_002229 [Claviceps maximensis]|nr:hypothetical protein E4U21_002229 [Claviceps maximensis]
MASPTARSSPSTPLGNQEKFSKICKDMKSWISQPPHARRIDTSSHIRRSSSSTAEIAVEESSHESSTQNDASTGGSDIPRRKDKDTVNVETGPLEHHEEPENKPTREMPAPGRVQIVSASTIVPERNASSLSVILEAAEHSPESISDPISAVKSSSSRPLEGHMSRPLGVIQATVPSPISLQTKASLRGKSWSISSNCDSDNTDKIITFGPTFPQAFPNRSDSGNADCATREVIYDNLGDDVVLHHQDTVKSWLVKHFTSPSILIPLHKLSDLVSSRCDIDPETGTFLAPILQPETLRCAKEGPCEGYHDILWRQSNMTSELYIMKELRSRENIATRLQMAVNHEANCFDLTSESGRNWPKANCTVRPANQLDFPAIAKIVNEHSKRAIKSQEIQSPLMHAEDVARVWDECRVNNRPFIVVTPNEEDFLDRSKWPNQSETIYQEFARFMAKHPRPIKSLVGFAFIGNPELGLDNLACPGTFYSGRLNLIVHPDHRGKLYGSALLDRILISISPLHTSVVDHDWSRNKNEPDGIYEFPASHNLRQYTLLHVEVLESRDKAEPSESRIHFLKKFGFEEVGRLKNVLVTGDDPGHMHWSDLVTWARGITPTSNVIGGWCTA